MPNDQQTSSPGHVSRLLAAVRAGRSQTAAAHASGFSQSKISRAEKGRHPFTPDEARRYAEALGAAPALVRDLVEASEALTAERITSRTALMRVGHTIQERIYRYEQDATLIRAWQPEIVLGILQHPDYTRALVGDVDHAWWEPRRRRLALLHTPGKMWHQLMSEAALRWVLGSYDVMATQLSHLDQMIAAVPTLRLGIVPLGVPQPIAPPAAFHVYDKQVAIDATQTATAFLTQPKDIAHYVREFDKLAGIALYGDGARDLLGRVAAEYGDKRS